MANNKYAGYAPDPSKEKEGNRLEKFNPYEFRKGMDYELTAVGCNRLAESTVEERGVATEKVLKNLEEHQSYYSALIQFEGGMNHGSKITESSFKKFLETYNPGSPGTGMVEVDKEIKDDKMTEPKYNKEDYTIQLKEAIKREIKNILSESNSVDDTTRVKDRLAKHKSMKAYDDEGKEFDDVNDDVTDVKASKGARGKEKAIKALDKEIEKLNKEKTKNLDKLSGPLAKYKDGKLTADEYKKLSADMVARNKEIIDRLGEIDKEKGEISLNEKLGRREVAKTMMEKDTHMSILEIIKEYGISLREGSDGIRPYYEIAKTAYQEGFMAGLHKN